MRIGSGCQVAAAFSALAVEAGSEAVLVLAWSDLLGLFADGVPVVFWAVRFLLVAATGCWWAVRTWALKGARLWKVSLQVLQVKVRSAACLSCAFRWRLRTDLSENFLSQRLHSYGFSPVWVRTWVLRFPERNERRSSHRSGSDALYKPFSRGAHHPRIEFPTISKYDLVLV